MLLVKLKKLKLSEKVNASTLPSVCVCDSRVVFSRSKLVVQCNKMSKIRFIAEEEKRHRLSPCQLRAKTKSSKFSRFSFFIAENCKEVRRFCLDLVMTLWLGAAVL